jgi:hypothetical protein
MTTNYPMIGIVTDASREIADQMFSALPEWGHGTFGIALAPTSAGPATHWAFGNSGASYEDGVTALAFLSGVFPEVAWGEGDWPSEAEAIAACAPDQLGIRVYGGEDGLTPVERFNAWMAEMSLVRVEDE